MMRFVMVDATGLVVAFINASSADDPLVALNTPADAEAVPCEDLAVRPGKYRYDDGVFSEIASARPPSLSRIAYQRLFTQAERIAIRASVDPVVVDFRELAALAETIDLDDPDVVAGTRYLEAHGLIGVGRADVVLAGPAT